MSGTRKSWLKALASRSKDAWLTAVRPREHDGFTRIETRRTIYCFKDAVCIEVLRRDYEPVDDAPFIGLRIVGWVSEEDEVMTGWRPGARAILWRPGAPGEEESAVALTSPSFAFLRVLPREDEDDEQTLTTLRRGLRRPPPQPPSQTRVLASA